MTKYEAMKLALEALESASRYGAGGFEDAKDALREALAWQERYEAGKLANRPEGAQVSPLEFVTMTMEKEHLVGKPIIWAQWPNEEKT